MKRIFSMVVMAVLAASLVPVVHAADCSNATLRGTYTLQASGFYKACKSCKTVPSAIAGIGTFDGAGNFTDLYTQSIDGQVVRNVTDHGTYTVNPDCTGSFEEASGAYHWDFALKEKGSEGVAIETDNGVTQTGTLKKQ